MKVSALLLTTVLLVAAAAAATATVGTRLDVNLNAIYDVIQKLNQTTAQNYFAEDLTNLTEGVKQCGPAFYCKVHDILQHKNFKLVKEDYKLKTNLREAKIVRNLRKYLDSHRVNCSLVLMNVETSDSSTPMPQFWEKVTHCIRTCNLYGCN